MEIEESVVELCCIAARVGRSMRKLCFDELTTDGMCLLYDTSPQPRLLQQHDI